MKELLSMQLCYSVCMPKFNVCMPKFNASTLPKTDFSLHDGASSIFFCLFWASHDSSAKNALKAFMSFTIDKYNYTMQL